MRRLVRLKTASLALVGFCWTVGFGGQEVRAAPADLQVQALGQISESAIRLCPAASETSRRTETEIKASINAELSGLTARLGNLGFHPSGSYKDLTTSGVVQAELASLIKATYDCRVKVLEILVRTFAVGVERTKN